MYRDKLTKTIRNLNLKFEGLSELLEDRNLLLKVLMGKEMREDFLLSERLQSLDEVGGCLLYTSPSPRDRQKSRMPSSA